MVVKVGSSILAGDGGGLDAAAVPQVVAQVAGLHDSGFRAVLVSSGAVAAGLPALGLDLRPTDIPGLQAAAAVGQGRLMAAYAAAFASQGLIVGQVLLTRDVLANRDQYLHAREALERMVSMDIVPIVNENDTVVIDELRVGDNDRLAAIVSHLTDAGMLVLLTDTPGLLSADPRFEDAAELIDAVRHTDRVLDTLGAGRAGPLGSGGVATKVAAARMAAWSGIPTAIVPGSEPDAVARAVAGEAVGTWVKPHRSGLSARKLWIAFGLPSVGRLLIDDGAVRALIDDGRSLLPAGVVGVTGVFAAGAAVEIYDRAERLVGKGLAALGAGTVRIAAGRHTSEAGGVAVHRDDLVVFA